MPRVRLFVRASGCLYLDATDSQVRALRNIPWEAEFCSTEFFRRLKEAGVTMDPTIARHLDWELQEASIVDDDEGRRG